MFGGFHTAKYVENCIDWEVYPRILCRGKLRQTQVFGNVFDAVLNGTNCVRSMKGYLILVNVIEMRDFFELHSQKIQMKVNVHTNVR